MQLIYLQRQDNIAQQVSVAPTRMNTYSILQQCQSLQQLSTSTVVREEVPVCQLQVHLNTWESEADGGSVAICAEIYFICHTFH